mgnify:CR=1 FL=1
MWLIKFENSNQKWCQAIKLGNKALVIGRGKECDLAINDNQLSRKHAVIEKTDDELTIRDLGSTSGTLINGEKCLQSAIQEGDEIALGSSTLRVVAQLPEAKFDAAIEKAPATFLTKGDFQLFLSTLTKSDSPQRVLQNLLSGLVSTLGAERGFVLMKGEDKDMQLVAAHQVTEETEFIAVSKTVYEKALSEKENVLVPNSAITSWMADTRTQAHYPQPRSIICAPLSDTKMTYGVIYLDRPINDGVFDNETLEFFSSVSEYAANLVASRVIRNQLSMMSQRLEAYTALSDEKYKLVVGEGEAAADLRRHLDAAAPQDVSVLITGETGSGKEVAARALHKQSKRRTGPFIPVHCAALSEEIIAAELFGHEKGAFTGATDARIGRFEMASGGTLFLDEVGDIPLGIQVKLLRVLQDRAITRLGGATTIPVDFRLVCATNIDLEEAVREGTFRKDLYYRINVFRISLRPLRERREDILPLANYFLADFAMQMGRRVSRFSKEAEQLLVRHSWPGNVRELRNAIERAVVFELSDEISAENLPIVKGSGLSTSAQGDDEFWGSLPHNFEEACDCFHGRFFELLIKHYDRNMSAVARAAGVARSTLYRHLSKHGLDTDEE